MKRHRDDNAAKDNTAEGWEESKGVNLINTLDNDVLGGCPDSTSNVLSCADQWYMYIPRPPPPH